AELAAEPVPAGVKKVLAEAYPADAAAGMFDSKGGVNVNCVIPKPFDPRVVPRVARRVAEAAMKSGVAQLDIGDLDAYEKSVAERLGK
ncbi:MAG TPA: NADP-dependent malic enzyme, partial [Lentisphaeria bacterium]|nr:NADP-dependent malic enzyme [Lentisphaeria bacterium]